MFNIQKQPVLVSDGTFLLQKPHWLLGLKGIRVAGSQLWLNLLVPLIARRSGTMVESVTDALQSTSSWPSSSFVLQISTLLKNLDQ